MFLIILLLLGFFSLSTQNETFNEATFRNKHPYQVIIIPNDGKSSYICSGSLISETKVLTAASCAKNMRYINLYFGYHEFLVNISSDQQTIAEKRTYFNFEFDASTFKNDIAIIELETKVKLNDFVQPIKLDGSNDDHAGELGVVAGWSRATLDEPYTSNLKSVQSRIMSNDECKNFSKKLADILQPTHICLSNVGIKETCGGDDGSPLVIEGVQVGIASFQSKACYDLPVGFTRVNMFQTWIKSKCSDCQFDKMLKKT